MRKPVKELKEERGVQLQAMTDLAKPAQTEKRSLTDDEEVKWDAFQVSLDSLDKEIVQAEQVEAIELRSAGQALGEVTKKEETEIRNYSFARAISSQIQGNAPLDGFEKEMHDEAIVEARSFGEVVEGVGIPKMVLETRTLNVTSSSADGAAFVGTEQKGYIDELKGRLALTDLGVNFMTGLEGNIEFVRGKGGTVSGWGAELATLVKSNPKSEKLTLTPNKLGTYISVSDRLLIQGGDVTDNYIKNLLLDAQAIALDNAAFNGTGADDQPLGLFNTTDVNIVSLGTNGDAMTRAALLAMEKVIEVAGGGKNMTYVTNPEVKAFLRDLEVVAGSGRFVWAEMADLLNGLKAISTNSIAKNLTKGSGTNLSGLGLGDFSKMIIGQWGGMNLKVDPYTNMLAGFTNILASSFYDIGIEQPKAFTVIKDIDLS